MPNMTIAIPEDLKQRMDAEATVNWSAVAREAFEQRLTDTDILRRIEGLRKLKGSAKLLSKKERERRRRELEGKDQSYILRKFGLDR